MDFFAHSTQQDDQHDWQRLRDHLIAVGELAAQNAAHFGFDAQALARLQGQLHDLGKYTREFQQRLHGGAPVDHATWGARMAVQRYGDKLGMLLGYGIAGHHAGLPNGKNGASHTALKDRLDDEQRPKLLPDWEKELSLPATLPLPVGFRTSKEQYMFQAMLLVRMLFSCLVDADHVDTNEFYHRVEPEKNRLSRSDRKLPTLEQLRERLDVKLASFDAGNKILQPGEKMLADKRAEILTHVRNQATQPPGLFSLTVPTGGGKTLASLAFALDHAIAHGLRRVIYVIPYTSIIDQTARVFRDAFGELGTADIVLEHHSAFDEKKSLKTDKESKKEGEEEEEKTEEEKEGEKKRNIAMEKRSLAMENWDAPVIVTSAVQFFESLFADRKSRCRKLHNIAGSVVILDEAQTLPLNLLRPCVALIDELARNYRTSIVLCTATQPALLAKDGFEGGLENVRQLAPDPPELYDALRRVTVRHIGTLDDAALTAQMREREQVLCIVNNRKHARAVYDSIADLPGAAYLTTWMFPNHRREALKTLCQRLKEGKPCRLVATSLVEAGVDIDFPLVLRAEAGLDSIAQAAGRCNRESHHSPGQSEVLVFRNENPDWAPPHELKQYAQVFQEILCKPEYKNDLLAPATLLAYFKRLYWQKGSNALDRHALLKLIRDSSPENLPFETLASKFRLIESAMLPVIVPLKIKVEPDGEIKVEPDEEIIKKIDSISHGAAAARCFQPYLVQVPHYAYQKLLEAHAIQPIAPERYGEQFMQLVNTDLYDKCTGLHWDCPEFIRADKLMW
jgi:CRISPR-associated endonuclease/helicase Cas3